MSYRLPTGDTQDLEQTLLLLSKAVEELQKSIGMVTNVVPVRPIEGMVRIADGTNWDPGSGAGMYLYLGGAWNKL